MRLLLLFPFLAAIAASARVPALQPVQDAPIRFGLWEGRFLQRTTVHPATASILKQQGQQIPASFTRTYRVCMDQAKWLRTKASIASPPAGCSILDLATNPAAVSLSARCNLKDGTSIYIGSDIAWQAGTRSHSTLTMRTIYPGSIGEVVVDREVNAHFIAPGCGRLAPGQTISLPRTTAPHPANP